MIATPVYAVLSVSAGASLAWYLLPAGVRKLRDVPSFAAGLREYDLLPAPLVYPIALTIPPVECVLGGMVLAGVAPVPSSAATTVLCAVFAVLVGITLVRGKRIECHCQALLATRVVGPGALVRNVGLVLLSATVLMASVTYGALTGNSQGSLAWLSLVRSGEWGFTLLAAAGFVGILYLCEWTAEAWRGLGTLKEAWSSSHA